MSKAYFLVLYESWEYVLYEPAECHSGTLENFFDLMIILPFGTKTQKKIELTFFFIRGFCDLRTILWSYLIDSRARSLIKNT